MIKFPGHIALFLLAVCLITGPAAAQSYSRQYYGGWKKSSTKDYHYRTYYYKPKPKYQGYKHHYVVKPKQSKHVYYYNPYTKKYWGRCAIAEPAAVAEPTYSKLPAEKQAGKIKDIPEEAFPPAAAFPAIPEAEDDVQMDAPPDDLPADVLPED